MQERIATALSLGDAGRTPESIARQQSADAQAEQMLAEVAGPRAQMARATPGGLESVIIGATQGMTFGGADELAGGMRALGAAIDPSMTMGEGYALGRDRARGMLDAAERERPFTTGLGTAAGGVATALT
jgi:hypothetical protein